MVSKEEASKIVNFVRDVIRKGSEASTPDLEIFEKKKGVFVSLYEENGNLRGCMGVTKPDKLSGNLREAAEGAAHRDPRFDPVGEEGINDLKVEVSLLTPPQKVNEESNEGWLGDIEVGRDGLIVKKGSAKGLLLPQVPIKHEWDKETFLSQTCRKAGLPPFSWMQSNIDVFKFQAEVFGEEEPGGEVEFKLQD